jgi:hypothetical protein
MQYFVGLACLHNPLLNVNYALQVGCDWKGGKMASEGEVWVQLATRIPKQLHRELKLYCVKSDVSVMDFVVSALQDKLGRDARGGRERRRARAS